MTGPTAAGVARTQPAVDPDLLLTEPGRLWRDLPIWRRCRLILLVLALLLTAMMVFLAVGMWRNDLVIDAQPVRATATVLSVNSLSTGVEFVDGQGVSRRTSVLYPGKLAVGQQFLVDYAASDPTLARVAGRSVLNGLVMPASVVLVTWLVTLPLLWWLRRRGIRRAADLHRVVREAAAAARASGPGATDPHPASSEESGVAAAGSVAAAQAPDDTAPDAATDVAADTAAGDPAGATDVGSGAVADHTAAGSALATSDDAATAEAGRDPASR